MCAGIVGGLFLGPNLIDKNLNIEKYTGILLEHIIREIQNVVGSTFKNIWFQQDGAPPRYDLQII